MSFAKIFMSAAGVAAIAGLCALAPASRASAHVSAPSAIWTPHPQPTCGPPVTLHATKTDRYCPV